MHKKEKINFIKFKLIVACNSHEKSQLIKIKENAERNNIKRKFTIQKKK